MVNDVAVPVQATPFVNVGVTIIVAVTGAVPTLVAVNAAMFPETWSRAAGRRRDRARSPRVCRGRRSAR